MFFDIAHLLAVQEVSHLNLGILPLLHALLNPDSELSMTLYLE